MSLLKTRFLIIIVVALVVLGSSAFTVDQRNQALVLQFGEVLRDISKPGLKFKIPFVQDVVYYDKRILDLDPPPFEVLLTDKKRIIADAFARYRIIEPAIFYQRARSEVRLRDIFGKNLNAALQRVLATVSLSELLSTERVNIMQLITDDVLDQAESFGIEVIDVRIGRTDLPRATSEAVYHRMRTEREREARELRAQGNEAARRIRAQADKEVTIIIAEADRQSQILKGEGEAERNRILAASFNQDPEFFKFYRSLDAYKESFSDQSTTLVLDPTSDFFRFFKDIGGR